MLRLIYKIGSGIERMNRWLKIHKEIIEISNIKCK